MFQKFWPLRFWRLRVEWAYKKIELHVHVVAKYGKKNIGILLLTYRARRVPGAFKITSGMSEEQFSVHKEEMKESE